MLSMTIAGVLADAVRPARRSAAAAEATGRRACSATQHVARLGGELFGRHLIAVEVAGTLLLVALVGAAAIVAQEPRASDRRRPIPVIAAMPR